MTKNLLLVAIAGGALTLAGSAYGQSSTTPAPAPPASTASQPGVHDPGHPRINQVDNRVQNQDKRIEQGVRNGTLTKEQARNLYRHDQAIQRQERRDAAANGGHLTKQEQQNINRELNRNSRKVYKDKH